MDVRAVPRRNLEQHARGLRLYLGSRSAHQPRDRCRPLGVVDHHHLAVERARLAVEGLDLLAVACTPHRERRSCDPVEVECVQRLPGQEHHVVGDVHDVVDRPLAGRGQAGLQPCGRLADRDVLQHPRGEAGAQLRALHVDVHTVHRSRRSGVRRPGLGCEHGSRGGVQLAGDPVDAEAVRPVGGDLQLEHLHRDGESVRERRSGGWRAVDLVEDEDALAARSDLKLALAEDHAFGDDPAELGLAQLRAVRHHRAGTRDRDALARRDVRSTADYARGLLQAEVDRAHPQAVCIGVRLRAQHEADDEVLGARDTVGVDRLDLRPGHRQALLDRSRVQRRIAVFAQPRQRHPHPNCSRKRRSFS